MAGLLTLNESCDAIFTSKVCHRFAFEKQGDDTTTDTGSLSNTVKTLENIRKELKETQATWQEEIKEMINNISKGKAQEENLRKDKKDKQNEKNINVKEIIAEMKTEFKNQMKQNNDEWNERLEAQRRSDNEWDRRIKDLNDYTKEAIGSMMITIKEILVDTKETNKIREPTSAEKRKVDTTREEEYEEYDDEGNQNTIDSNLVNTRLRRKVSMSEAAIRALEQKLMEQDRALLAKSNREKKRATKKQNDKNE